MSPPNDLPSSREFVTKLLASLNALPQHAADVTTTATTTGIPPRTVPASASNPLSNASEPVKKHLMTLHVLFPNELLPALDLLDRGLVTRFHVQRPEATAVAAPTIAAAYHPNGSKHFNASAPASRSPLLQPKTDAKQVPTPRVEQSNETETQLDDKQPAPSRLGTTTAPAHPFAQTQPRTQSLGFPDQAVGPESLSPTAATSHRSLGAQEHSVSTATNTHTSAERTLPEYPDTVYYVRSAQHRPSRFATSVDTSTTYEVRLRAWNCTCPAFAFAAFPPTSFPLPHTTPRRRRRSEEDAEEEQDVGWRFGGCSLENDGKAGATAPACKHLLACVLGERCAELFGEFVVEREVTGEEAAGWAAGWGD